MTIQDIGLLAAEVNSTPKDAATLWLKSAGQADDHALGKQAEHAPIGILAE